MRRELLAGGGADLPEIAAEGRFSAEPGVAGASKIAEGRFSTEPGVAGASKADLPEIAEGRFSTEPRVAGASNEFAPALGIFAGVSTK